MIRTFTILAAAGALTALATLAPPTASEAASTRRCAPQTVNATGVGHGILGFATRGGTRNAISTWQQMVTLKYGSAFASWSNAGGASVSCGKTLLRVECVASATPCRA